MKAGDEITFRRMLLEDLPLLHRWVNSDGIRQVWSQGAVRSFEEVAAKYGPRISGRVATDAYLILHPVASCVITPEEGNPVAIQAYEKAGFRHLRTADIPGEPGPIHLMRKERE